MEVTGYYMQESLDLFLAMIREIGSAQPAFQLAHNRVMNILQDSLVRTWETHALATQSAWDAPLSACNQLVHYLFAARPLCTTRPVIKVCASVDFRSCQLRRSLGFSSTKAPPLVPHKTLPGIASLHGSGTEAKLKYYVQLHGNDAAEVTRTLLDMVKLIVSSLLKPEHNGLRWAGME
ncbi:hypothetical protein GUITHDRAFT_132991 [Guillardia theta CCMP2712]|uniref:Uncharacterized protein n=1 Tax=Guillardia theta (strain CCMP2712) TaxID=905079 RepID=L1JY11_GUITC|nr:hypothetical protein GUITHDRAFT_132991 [Guillardia theta CCMP2712]EKX53242.1 hypothetical protein GUITHDRAFT_132991 [Guillardia theta CCMP2712]|eukprot:XP_005840222.1 hypothetical protein GUITHDRAFT_132991 [Guillardia theta CCMP2712]